MMYQHSYQSHNKPKRSWKFSSTWIPISILALLFIVSVFWFRSGAHKTKIENLVDSTAHVLTPKPVDQAVVTGGIELQSYSASLKGVKSGQVVGQATRGQKDGRYFFETKAALPAIDRETQFYAVWLVRPVPYKFVSLGEMLTNDVGDFVLVWQPGDEEDMQTYSRIVITLQAKGGNPDPQGHVAEGEFGK